MLNNISDLEKNRKLIYLSSIWIPILLNFLPRKSSIIIFSLITIIILILEFSRKYSIKSKIFMQRFMTHILKKSELSASLTDASFFLIAILVNLLFFGKEEAIISSTILIISNSLSSFVGIKYGKVRFGGKTLEGSLTFFISSLLILIIFNYLFNLKFAIYKIFFIIFVVNFFEAISGKIGLNDDLLISIIFSFLMDFI